MRIGIIGTGWVGSSVAISVLHSGIARELLLCDVRTELAEGEALDLAHGASFYRTARVRAADVEEMIDCDAVVISACRSAGTGGSPNAVLRDNAAIVGALAMRLARLRGLLVVVTSPVDVLTQVAFEASGLPPSRVIGTGTMPDTALLRHVIGRELKCEPRSVHAQVIGQHGDSEVIVWSGAQIGGFPLRRWSRWTSELQTKLSREVRTGEHEIIRRKGASNHAIGLTTATLLNWALSDEHRVLTVSRAQDGALGIVGVSLSLPTIVGREGATMVLEPDLDSGELSALMRSVDTLRATRAALQSQT